MPRRRAPPLALQRQVWLGRPHWQPLLASRHRAPWRHPRRPPATRPRLRVNPALQRPARQFPCRQPGRSHWPLPRLHRGPAGPPRTPVGRRPKTRRWMTRRRPWGRRSAPQRPQPRLQRLPRLPQQFPAQPLLAQQPLAQHPLPAQQQLPSMRLPPQSARPAPRAAERAAPGCRRPANFRRGRSPRRPCSTSSCAQVWRKRFPLRLQILDSSRTRGRICRYRMRLDRTPREAGLKCSAEWRSCHAFSKARASGANARCTPARAGFARAARRSFSPD
jgi:hypothetical protein